LADCNGDRISINSYDEYGIPGTTNTGRFQYTGQAWIPELGIYYYKARMYSPTLGRFLQTDPVGYLGGMNLYGYTNDDPVDRVDPMGFRDIYVGGASDKDDTRLVQNYVDVQRRAYPTRDIEYYSWRELTAINAALTRPLKAGEPLNLIGHSLGGSSELIAARSMGAHITNLLTIDPVGSAGDGKKPANTSFWGNITAAPSAWGNRSDLVANVGRLNLGYTNTAGADQKVIVDAHHGDFSDMMQKSQADTVINQSYRNTTQCNSQPPSC
jgi:RHS repeat-associated protein